MPESDLSARDQAGSVAVNADTCLLLLTAVEAGTATGRSFVSPISAVGSVHSRRLPGWRHVSPSFP